MDGLDEFLEELLRKGRIAFRRRPAEDAWSARAAGVLERAYADFALDVAGPPIAFDAAVAREACEVVVQASWALVCHEDRLETLERRLTMRHPPTRPSHHLSADLVFRYLAQVHRRARAINPDDPFAAMLAKLLREWPLSGVLAGLEGGPASPTDFGGHEGLMLLYAERWARHELPAWRPTGRALEYAEMVHGGTAGGSPAIGARGEDLHG